MNRHTETNVWHRPESYAPDLFDQRAVVEHYEKLARQARGIAWNDVLFGAACGLVAGMLGTVGLAYVWAMFL